MQIKPLIVSLPLIFLSVSGAASDAKRFDRSLVRDAVVKLLPKESNKFSMVEIPAEADIQSTSNTLGKYLIQCASSKANLAIAGANNELNYVVLRTALVANSDTKLSGCHIIYVGNESNFEDLNLLASKAGAEFHATTYPEK